MTRFPALFALCVSLLASSAHSAEELLAAVLDEQQAFKEGNCDAVEAVMAADITFYANGRKMTREQVGNFCRSIKRPFGAGRSPISDTVTPYQVSETLGYTVRDFRWHDAEDRVIHEVVTKIWSRGEDGWKMVHFQSTVVPEAGPDQRR